MGALALIQSITLWQVLAVAVFTFFFSNFVEYVVHRFPMHRMVKHLKGLYRGHAGEHHRYFTHEYMNIEQRFDLLVAMTNPRAIVMLIGAIMIPMSILFGLLFGASIGLFAYVCFMLNYFLFEVTHLATHVPNGHWLLKIPYFRDAKERHKLHHNTREMREWNFNVSFPLFDRVFKTLHPERGYELSPPQDQASA